MPFPNEHAARLKSPGQFDDFRRSNDELGSGIDAIFGIKTRQGERVSEIQSIRFDKRRFSPDAALAWLEDHDFKPIDFEPAEDDAREARVAEAIAKTKTGLTVMDITQMMSEIGRKFIKEEVGFLGRAESPEVVCGACRFYLRSSHGETGRCQIVEGGIPWFSTCDLYISAAAEAAAVFNAEEAEKDRQYQPDSDAVDAEEARKKKKKKPYRDD